MRERVMSALREKMEIEDKGSLAFALDTRIQRNVEEGILKLSQTVHRESDERIQHNRGAG